MTTFKLVRALLRTMQKGQWHLSYRGFLVTQQPGKAEQCPLAFAATVATGNFHSTTDFINAGNALGISMDQRNLVVDAADNWPCHSESRLVNKEVYIRASQKLRKIMLKALKLK